MPASATNGTQLIAAGIRELALAGAATANPQGPTTIFRNPAGLSYVAGQTEVGSQNIWVDARAGFNGVPNSTAKSGRDFAILPSAGVSFKARPDDPNTYGLALSVTSASGVQYAWGAPIGAAGNSEYQGITMAFGGARKLDEKWSVGLAANINIGRLSFSNPGFGPNTLPSAFASTSQTIGLGFSVGAIYQPNERSRYGLSYVSKYNLPESKYTSPEGTWRADFDFPDQWALGGWWAIGEKWEVSADIRQIRYSSTNKSFIITAPNGAEVDLRPEWDDVTAFAIGAKYRASDKLDVAFGANLGNNPVPASRTSANFLFPGIQKQTYTLGTFYRASDRIEVQAALAVSPKSEISDGTMTISNTLTTFGMGITLKY